MAFRRPRGTQDILPGQSEVWHLVFTTIRNTLERYGYAEIRTPVFEETQLFVRGVGEETDIVQKEMYTFPDRKGRSLTLRPEGTAAVVRSYLENNLGREAGVKRLFYIGSMYRYDRPQAGRYREFVQVGAEAIGNALPEQDVEIIDLMMAVLRDLGLDELTVDVNSVGSPESRRRYEDVLRGALESENDALCDTCRGRTQNNPLRVFDCKNPQCQTVAARLPKLRQYLSAEDREHYASVLAGLDALEIGYRENDMLVRGLDYYTRTAFEVHYPPLGAQSAVGGGGRYDGLVEACGGPATPAVGFSSGIERILFALEQTRPERIRVVAGAPITVMPVGDAARRQALRLAHALRAVAAASVDLSGRSLKAQLRSAGKTSARVAVILGDTEIADRTVTVRDLEAGEQSTHALDAIDGVLRALLHRSDTVQKGNR